MNLVTRGLRWTFSRRLLGALFWMLLILAGAFVVNLVGIHIVGNVDQWSGWLKNHSWFLLAWRLCVYVATGYGWWWMRKRVLAREPSAESRFRLKRTEVAAVFTVLILEGAVFLQSR